MEIGKELEEELRQLKEQRANLEADSKLIKNNMEFKSDVRKDRLDSLNERFEEGNKLIEKILNEGQIIEIMDNVRKNFERYKDEPNYKKMQHSVLVDGALKLDESLELFKFDKKSYELMTLEDPERLITEIRIAIERQARNLRSLMINSIPIDRELLEKMNEKEQREAFKGVLLKSFTDLHRRYDMNLTPEMRWHFSLEESFLKIVEYSFQYGNTYEGGFDSTTPIFLAQDTKMNAIRNGYFLDGKEIKGLRQFESELQIIKDKVEIQDRQYALKTDKIGNLDLEISNKETKVKLLDETLKGLEEKIEKKRQEFLNLNAGNLNNDNEDE